MYTKLKNDILGKDYNLSIAYVSEATSRELNKKYRKKDKATNILSFSLRKEMGELVLCKAVIQKEARLRLAASDGQAKKLKDVYRDYVGFLLIHGMLHLKGFEHGKAMEKLEEEYLSRTTF